jgi:hypothetical protein
MSEPRDHYPQTDPTPQFPWKHVLFTALAVLALVGIIILIRKGGGAALATAAPAVALGVVRANRRRASAGVHDREPIDMDFLKAQLRQGASEKVVVTPTELKIVLNGFFEKNNFSPPFESEQQMAKILSPLGLHSKVRTMPGRSERRWYDLAAYGNHEAPIQ